jgi:hypothetical protein
MTVSKIFVGILYSGENEYDECKTSIETQSYFNYDLYCYEFLPKLDAHRTLYHDFLNQRNNFDILIKIDADMVLTSDLLFEKIIQKFNQNNWMDVLGIAILDFFSGGYINGLNSYRNTVKWELDPGNVNADKVIVEKDHYFFDEKELAPAAYHCKNPSKLQAFHFGVHRAIKVFAPKHGTTHFALLEKTWKNFLHTKDVRIGLAVLGAELVYAGQFNKEDVDYTNPKVRNVLEDYQDMSSDRINKEIIKLRWRHWGFLPSDLRRRVIRNKISPGSKFL